MNVSGPPATTPSTPYTSLTAESVKVLAHPMRSHLLGALRKLGPSSATTLAAALHTNTGSASYHLRRLESVGLVEDTGLGRGKERIWRSAASGHRWENTDFADDEDARTALDWLRRGYSRDADAAYSHWLDVAESWPVAWQNASGMSDGWVTVTPEQAGLMGDELDAVIEKYRSAGAGDPRARRLHIYRMSFPLDADDVPDAPGQPQ